MKHREDSSKHKFLWSQGDSIQNHVHIDDTLVGNNSAISLCAIFDSGSERGATPPLEKNITTKLEY